MLPVGRKTSHLELHLCLDLFLACLRRVSVMGFTSDCEGCFCLLESKMVIISVAVRVLQ